MGPGREVRTKEEDESDYDGSDDKDTMKFDLIPKWM